MVFGAAGLPQVHEALVPHDSVMLSLQPRAGCAVVHSVSQSNSIAKRRRARFQNKKLSASGQETPAARECSVSFFVSGHARGSSYSSPACRVYSCSQEGISYRGLNRNQGLRLKERTKKCEQRPWMKRSLGLRCSSPALNSELWFGCYARVQG